jgi:hypothetical protein
LQGSNPWCLVHQKPNGHELMHASQRCRPATVNPVPVTGNQDADGLSRFLRICPSCRTNMSGGVTPDCRPASTEWDLTPAWVLSLPGLGLPGRFLRLALGATRSRPAYPPCSTALCTCLAAAAGTRLRVGAGATLSRNGGFRGEVAKIAKIRGLFGILPARFSRFSPFVAPVGASRARENGLGNLGRRGWRQPR